MKPKKLLHIIFLDGMFSHALDHSRFGAWIVAPEIESIACWISHIGDNSNESFGRREMNEK